MASSSGADGGSKNETTNAATDEMSIEDLQKEIEVLKRRIIDERNKLCDKTVVQVAEAIDMVQGLNVKVRRSLKGHNAKVLCLDWSTDKRHLVSSSQASTLLITMLQKLSKCEVKTTRCGHFTILLPFRFYVKSNLVNSNSQEMSFLAILEVLDFDF